MRFNKMKNENFRRFRNQKLGNFGEFSLTILIVSIVLNVVKLKTFIEFQINKLHVY